MHMSGGPGSSASSFSIRRAGVEDYAAFVSLFPELGVDDPVPSAEAWARVLVPGCWVAVAGGDVVGYCYVQEYADTGYVRNVVVARNARRAGVGRALMEEAAAHLRSGGRTSWKLNVVTSNTAALALYARMGMNLCYRAQALRFPWRALPAIPLGQDRPREVTAARDALSERVFSLPRGQLAHARSLGRLILETVAGDPSAPGSDAGPPTGLAVFDRHFPGAFPFRVVTLDAVGPLLREIRGRVPDHEFINLVAEDDAVLATMLTGAGAVVRAEILHLEGPL